MADNPFDVYSPAEREGFRSQLQDLFQAGGLNPKQAETVHRSIMQLGGYNTTFTNTGPLPLGQAPSAPGIDGHSLAAGALAQQGIPSQAAPKGPSLAQDTAASGQHLVDSTSFMTPEQRARYDAGTRMPIFSGAVDVGQGVGEYADSFKDSAGDPNNMRYKAGTHVIGGAFEALAPFGAGGLMTKAGMKGLAAGVGSGYAASKATEIAGGSPEAQEFAGTAAFVAPSALGIARGVAGLKKVVSPQGTMYVNPEEGLGFGKTTTPEGDTIYAGRVGNTSVGVRRPGKPSPPQLEDTVQSGESSPAPTDSPSPASPVVRPSTPSPVEDVAPRRGAPPAVSPKPSQPTSDVLQNLERQYAQAEANDDFALKDSLAAVINHERAKLARQAGTPTTPPGIANLPDANAKVVKDVPLPPQNPPQDKISNVNLAQQYKEEFQKHDQNITIAQNDLKYGQRALTRWQNFVPQNNDEGTKQAQNLSMWQARVARSTSDIQKFSQLRDQALKRYVANAPQDEADRIVKQMSSKVQAGKRASQQIDDVVASDKVAKGLRKEMPSLTAKQREGAREILGDREDPSTVQIRYLNPGPRSPKLMQRIADAHRHIAETMLPIAQQEGDLKKIQFLQNILDTKAHVVLGYPRLKGLPQKPGAGIAKGSISEATIRNIKILTGKSNKSLTPEMSAADRKKLVGGLDPQSKKDVLADAVRDRLSAQSQQIKQQTSEYEGITNTVDKIAGTSHNQNITHLQDLVSKKKALRDLSDEEIQKVANDTSAIREVFGASRLQAAREKLQGEVSRRAQLKQAAEAQRRDMLRDKLRSTSSGPEPARKVETWVNSQGEKKVSVSATPASQLGPANYFTEDLIKEFPESIGKANERIRSMTASDVRKKLKALDLKKTRTDFDMTLMAALKTRLEEVAKSPNALEAERLAKIAQQAKAPAAPASAAPLMPGENVTVTRMDGKKMIAKFDRDRGDGKVSVSSLGTKFIVPASSVARYQEGDLTKPEAPQVVPGNKDTDVTELKKKYNIPEVKSEKVGEVPVEDKYARSLGTAWKDVPQEIRQEVSEVLNFANEKEWLTKRTGFRVKQVIVGEGQPVQIDPTYSDYVVRVVVGRNPDGTLSSNIRSGSYDSILNDSTAGAHKGMLPKNAKVYVLDIDGASRTARLTIHEHGAAQLPVSATAPKGASAPGQIRQTAVGLLTDPNRNNYTVALGMVKALAVDGMEGARSFVERSLGKSTADWRSVPMGDSKVPAGQMADELSSLLSKIDNEPPKDYGALYRGLTMKAVPTGDEINIPFASFSKDSSVARMHLEGEGTKVLYRLHGAVKAFDASSTSHIPTEAEVFVRGKFQVVKTSNVGDTVVVDIAPKSAQQVVSPSAAKHPFTAEERSLADHIQPLQEQVINLGHGQAIPKFKEWATERTDLTRAQKLDLWKQELELYLKNPGDKSFRAAYELSKAYKPSDGPSKPDKPLSGAPGAAATPSGGDITISDEKQAEIRQLIKDAGLEPQGFYDVYKESGGPVFYQATDPLTRSTYVFTPDQWNPAGIANHVAEQRQKFGLVPKDTPKPVEKSKAATASFKSFSELGEARKAEQAAQQPIPQAQKPPIEVNKPLSPEAIKARENALAIMMRLQKSGIEGLNLIKAAMKGILNSPERKSFVFEKALQIYEEGLGQHDPMALRKAIDLIRQNDLENPNPSMRVDLFGLGALANRLLSPKQIPVPSPAMQKILAAQAAAKDKSPSLLDAVRSIPYSLVQKWKSHFYYLQQSPNNFMKVFAPELIRGFEDRVGRKLTISEDPYKQARLAYGGGGGYAQVARIEFAQAKSEAEKAGLLDMTTAAINLLGYDRAIRNVTRKAVDALANAAQLKANAAKLYADIQSGAEGSHRLPDVTAWRAKASQLRTLAKDEAKLLKANKVVPGGYDRKKIKADLQAIKTSLGPKDWGRVAGWASTVFRHNSEAWDALYHSDRISDDVYNVGKQLGSHYIPLNRVLTELESTSLPSFGGDKSKSIKPGATVLRYFRGSERFNRDPWDTSLENVTRAYAEAQKNEVAKTILNLRDLDPAGWGKAILLDDGKPLVMGPNSELLNGKMPVFKNGEKYNYHVPNWLASTLANATPADVALVGGTLLRFFNNVLRVGATVGSVSFVAGQIPRNLLAYAGMSRSQPRGVVQTAKMVAQYVDSLKSTLLSDDNYKDMLRARAGYSSFQSALSNRELGARPITGALENFGKHALGLRPFKAMKDMIRTIEDVNMVLTNANKVLAWKRGKGMGMSDDEAAFDVRNFGGAPDYANAGTYRNAANLMFTFLTATMAHIGRTLDWVHNHPKEFAKFLGKCTLLAFLSMQYNMQYVRPDGTTEWSHIDRVDKAQNFIIIRPDIQVTSDGQVRQRYFKVPKPEHWRMFYDPIETAVSTFYDKEVKVADAAIDFVGSFLPLHARIEPQRLLASFAESVIASMNPALKEPFEQAANYDTWRRIPIESPGMQDLENPLKSSPSTSVTAQRITQTIYDNTGGASGFAQTPLLGPALTSPKRFEHLIHGTTGGLGAAVLSVTDAALGQDKSQGLSLEGDEAARRTPLIGPAIGRFVGNTLDQEEKDMESQFYSDLEVARKYETSLKHLDRIESDTVDAYVNDPKREKLITAYKDMQEISKDLSGLHQEIIQVVKDPKMTPEQKKQEIIAIHKDRISLLREYRDNIRKEIFPTDEQKKASPRLKSVQGKAIDMLSDGPAEQLPPGSVQPQPVSVLRGLSPRTIEKIAQQSRPLTAKESQSVRDVFGESLNPLSIRIGYDSSISGTNMTGYVLKGSTPVAFFPADSRGELPETFFHELTHIWQQNNRYQSKGGLPDGLYDIQSPEARALGFDYLGRDMQAERVRYAASAEGSELAHPKDSQSADTLQNIRAARGTDPEALGNAAFLESVARVRNGGKASDELSARTGSILGIKAISRKGGRLKETFEDFTK